MDNKFDMIFSTCEEYSFIWPSYFQLLKKYWPEFDAKIISTGKNTRSELFEIASITRRERASFSTRLLEALKMCNKDIVLFTLDDFFLWHRVSNDYFEHALSIMQNNADIKCINLFDNQPESYYSNGDFDEFFCYKKQADHVITTQLSLWRKDYLVRMLRKGESAWDFEYYSTARQAHYQGILLYPKDGSRDFFSYPRAGVMSKGAVNTSEEVKDFLKREGISLASPSKKTRRHPYILVWFINSLSRLYDVFYRKYNWKYRIPFMPRMKYIKNTRN